MTAQHPRRPRTAPCVAVVLPRLEATPEWMAVGACRFVDPDLFYSERNNLTRDPKRVCARCAVAEQCLQWALITDEPHGIWGGQSAGERKSLVDDVRHWAVATGARCPASGGIRPELLAAYEEAQHGERVA